MVGKNTITIATLRELVSAGAVSSVRLDAQAEGFAVLIRCGFSEKTLQARRGHIRLFKSLDRAVALLRDLGVARLEVDVSGWEPHQRYL